MSADQSIKQQLADAGSEGWNAVAPYIAIINKLIIEREELNSKLKRLRQLRSEPSRIEIAAMLMAANLSRETDQWDTNDEARWAVEQADALIAAAKEAE